MSKLLGKFVFFFICSFAFISCNNQDLNDDPSLMQKKNVMTEMADVARKYGVDIDMNIDNVQSVGYTLNSVSEFDSLLRCLDKPQCYSGRFNVNKKSNSLVLKNPIFSNEGRLKLKSIETGCYSGSRWVIAQTFFLHVNLEWYSATSRGKVSSYMAGIVGGEYTQDMGYSKRVSKEKIEFETDGYVKFTVEIANPVRIPANVIKSVHSKGVVNTVTETGSISVTSTPY